MPGYSGDPKLWFAQLDSSFIAQGVQATQRKLYVLISGLPATFTNTVKDIITDLSQGMPYNSFRTEVLCSNSKADAFIITGLR